MDEATILRRGLLMWDAAKDHLREIDHTKVGIRVADREIFATFIPSTSTTSAKDMGFLHFHTQEWRLQMHVEYEGATPRFVSARFYGDVMHFERDLILLQLLR